MLLDKDLFLVFSVLSMLKKKKKNQKEREKKKIERRLMTLPFSTEMNGTFGLKVQ